MPSGQEALQGAVDEVITRMKDDGSLAAIYQQWVGLDLTPQG